MPVNAAATLEQLLEERRSQIDALRLLVLKEIDPNAPDVLCDEAPLRVVLESILDETFARLQERADLYVASRRTEAGLGEKPAVRILIRFQTPAAEVEPALRVQIAPAEQTIRAQGGALSLDITDSGATVILIDLPAVS